MVPFRLTVSRLCVESTYTAPSPTNLALWRKLLGEIEDRLSKWKWPHPRGGAESCAQPKLALVGTINCEVLERSLTMVKSPTLAANSADRKATAENTLR